MSDDLRKQIFESLNLLETDELLDIWQSNNRGEWSDTAFEVIREILTRRGTDIPEQVVFVPGGDEKTIDQQEFTDADLKIVDDENPPAFYDPFDVLRVCRWLETTAKVMVGFVILYNLLMYSSSRRIIESYFIQYPLPLLGIVLTWLLVSLNIAFGAAIAYFTLIALSKVLKILMEMEFNSRKPSVSAMAGSQSE